MNDFQADVVAEFTRQGVINLRHIGKTRIWFCFLHKRKLDKFEGESREGADLVITACEDCGFASPREFGRWITAPICPVPIPRSSSAPEPPRRATREEGRIFRDL